MTTDFILNGVANGHTASQLLINSGGDVNVLRPFIGKDGRSYINRQRADGSVEAIVTNAGATLRDDEWRYIDSTVVKAFRARLKLVNWFRSAGLSMQLPGGIGRTTYNYERQSDISAARVNMDALAPGENDRPTYDMVSLPLPIVSKEVTMNWRQILESRNGNTPLDTQMMELAGIKVAEELEKLHLGTFGTYTFAGATLYGLTNHPNRNTGSVTALDGSWTPTKAYNDVLNMINVAYGDRKYGPFKLWYSTNYLPYMMQQFSLYDSTPLQTAISRIPQIASVELCDHLTGTALLLVEESQQSVRTIIGMDVTTVQWQEQGGLLEKFRVMACMVPQVTLDVNNNCGIVHFT